MEGAGQGREEAHIFMTRESSVCEPKSLKSWEGKCVFKKDMAWGQRLPVESKMTGMNSVDDDEMPTCLYSSLLAAPFFAIRVCGGSFWREAEEGL